jgi:hypothetical protein
MTVMLWSVTRGRSKGWILTDGSPLQPQLSDRAAEVRGLLPGIRDVAGVQVYQVSLFRG